MGPTPEYPPPPLQTAYHVRVCGDGRMPALDKEVSRYHIQIARRSGSRRYFLIKHQEVWPRSNSSEAAMANVTIDEDQLKRLRLRLAITAKARLWGVSDFAVEDCVERAMKSALLDASTGELKNFDADVFLSGLAVDERTRHLVDNPKPTQSSNPVHGDLTEEQFAALSPEERLKRANAASFEGLKRRAAAVSA